MLISRNFEELSMMMSEIEHEDFEKAQQEAQRGSALKGKRGRMR